MSSFVINVVGREVRCYHLTVWHPLKIWNVWSLPSALYGLTRKLWMSLLQIKACILLFCTVKTISCIVLYLVWKQIKHLQVGHDECDHVLRIFRSNVDLCNSQTFQQPRDSQAVCCLQRQRFENKNSLKSRLSVQGFISRYSRLWFVSACYYY